MPDRPVRFWVVFAPTGDILDHIKRTTTQYFAHNNSLSDFQAFGRLDDAPLWLKGNWLRVSVEVS